MKIARSFGITCLVLFFGCTGNGVGCDPDYHYPLTDPNAALTAKVVRTRITDNGFNSLARSVPDLLASTCSDTSGDGSCSTIAVGGQTRIAFYLGSASAPMNFSTTLGPLGSLDGTFRAGGIYPYSREFNSSVPLVTTDIERRIYCDDTGGRACQAMATRGLSRSGTGFCRDPDDASGCNDASRDYCCGHIAEYICDHPDLFDASCTAPRSNIALHMDTLKNNLHLKLINDDAAGDGLQVIIGCDEASGFACNRDHYVRGSADMVMMLQNDTAGDAACRISDDPGQQRAFEIRSFKFTMRPKIDSDAQGRPHLALADNDIQVDSFDVDLSIDIKAERSDPACYDESWTIFGRGSATEDCSTICGAGSVLNNLVTSLLEQGQIGRMLADSMAHAIFDQLNQLPLSGEGVVDISSMVPGGPNRRSQGMGFAVFANSESPQVTSDASHLGMNLDVDIGYAGEHSACVPMVTSPAWAIPVSADLGSTVQAPDPVTGELRSEVFDAGILLGDTSLARAAYELFDSGGLCLNFPGDALSRLTGGAFAATVGTLGLLAPGLSYLAPEDTLVDLAMVPATAPQIVFGSGEGEGESRDSHVQLHWSDVSVELYPLIDDAAFRALSFAVTLDVGVSLEPTPSGALQIVIDRLNVGEISEGYNELGLAFEASGISNLLGVFLPMLLSGDPIVVDFGQQLGLPLVPKIRNISRFDEAGRYLGLFMHFCTAEDLIDADNSLCYEASGDSSNGQAIRDVPMGLSAHVSSSDAASQSAWIEASADVATLDMLQIAYRLDNVGPYYSFRSVAANGLFKLEHPMLAVPGDHRLTVVARDKAAKWRWTAPVDVNVHVSAAAPTSPRSASAEPSHLPAVNNAAKPFGCNAASSSYEIFGIVWSGLAMLFAWRGRSKWR